MAETNRPTTTTGESKQTLPVQHTTRKGLVWFLGFLYTGSELLMQVIKRAPNRHQRRRIGGEPLPRLGARARRRAKREQATH